MKIGFLCVLELLTFSFICLSTYAMNFEVPTHTFNNNFHWVNANGDLVRVYATGDIAENSGVIFERFVKQNKIKRAIASIN